MSADLYWQHPASLPSLSPALMGFSLNNNEGTESTTKTETANPFWTLNRNRCILIRSVGHESLPSMSASYELPIK